MCVNGRVELVERVEGESGIPVRIISLEDLIANKKASGRAKDLADVEVLEGCRK